MKAFFLKWTMVCIVCLVALSLSGVVMAADKIDINTATVEQLTDLPGIGPAIASKIVEHRTTHPFTSPEQIMDVKGIGQGKYDAIKDLITVEATKPKKE